MTRLRPLLLAVCLLAAIRLAADEPCLATVAGCPIGLREVLLFVARDRAAVAREAFPGAPVITAAMWATARPDGSAADRLRARALSDAIAAKQLQVAGLQTGLLMTADFSAFEEDLATENARRARAVASGEVIYGPQVWTASTLYWQRQALLRERLAKLPASVKRPSPSSFPVSTYPGRLAQVPVD